MKQKSKMANAALLMQFNALPIYSFAFKIMLQCTGNSSRIVSNKLGCKNDETIFTWK